MHDRQRLLSQAQPGRAREPAAGHAKVAGRRRSHSTCRWPTRSARAATCCSWRPTTNPSRTSAAAVNAAVNAGATEVSNSYGGAEAIRLLGLQRPLRPPRRRDHRIGRRLRLLQRGLRWHGEAANFPASSPDVVAVGGHVADQIRRELDQHRVGRRRQRLQHGVHGAPVAERRSRTSRPPRAAAGARSADVAAVANPYTGVDVYDSTAKPGGDPTGWGVWGGTSVASPVDRRRVRAGRRRPRRRIPRGDRCTPTSVNGSALYDVVSGSNGSCTGASSCGRPRGYDGPTGVGSPIGLGAFATAGSPGDVSPPSDLRHRRAGPDAERDPRRMDGQPEHLQRAVAAVATPRARSCAAIAARRGRRYTLAGERGGLDDPRAGERQQRLRQRLSGGLDADRGRDLRRAAIAGFTPTSGLTGSAVTITGTAFTGASAVRFGASRRRSRVRSPTQIEATVPNGALAGDDLGDHAVKTGDQQRAVHADLSLASFSPAKAAPGATVTITGVGFEQRLDRELRRRQGDQRHLRLARRN